jgi:ATP-binding cassette subfamily B protein
MYKLKDTPKSAHFKSSIIKLIKELKRYIPAILIASILSILSTSLAILGPNLLKDIVNIIQEGLVSKIDMNALMQCAITIGVLCIFCFVCEILQSFILVGASHNFSKRLRSKVSHKVNKIPLKYFDSRPVGDIMSVITNDIDTIYDGLHQCISNLSYSVATLIGVVFMMFKTNWQMSLVSIFSTIIGFLLIGILVSKSKKYFKVQQKKLGDLNGYIEEMYSCHSIVTTYNGIEEAKKRFTTHNNDLARHSQRAAFLGGLIGPLMSFISSIGYIAVCVVGGILAMKNVIDFGTIIAFVFYVRIFSGPLNTISQSITKMQSVVAASERVFDFLDEEEMPSEDDISIRLEKNEVKGEVVFDNVTFAYENNPVLKNFSITINPGQKVAIVGHTGAGKSTLVNLLMKFYDITEGDIKIDGHSIKELSRSNVRDLFCMVLQNTWLFNGTIRENIMYNQSNLTEIDIRRSCELVGLSEFIETLPEEYETIIGESTSLSEGQKQLITIARAILDDSPFLILDEATSSVDRKTEQLVQKSIDTLTQGRTSFIIAHRLSTIQNADIILVLDHGNLVETGSHKDLIKKKGIYSELYYSQFSK